MSKPALKPVFREADTLRTNTKGSFFEQLLPARRSLFEKFPCANKGLVLTGPGIKLGQEGKFSFATTEKGDTLDFDHNKGISLRARYKKDAKLFDVTASWDSCCCLPGFVHLLKYEERNQASPHYVLGTSYINKKYGFSSCIKINPMTTQTKISALYEGGSFGVPNGLRFAADSKLLLNKTSSPDHIRFNLGVCYKNPLGQTSIAYNQDGLATLTHVHKRDELQVALEVVHPVVNKKKNAPVPLVLAASYQVDKTLVVRAKLNTDFTLSAGLKKDFSNNLNVSVGSNLDLQKIALQPPSLGFKVTMKS